MGSEVGEAALLGFGVLLCLAAQRSDFGDGAAGQTQLLLDLRHLHFGAGGAGQFERSHQPVVRDQLGHAQHVHVVFEE